MAHSMSEGGEVEATAVARPWQPLPPRSRPGPSHLVRLPKAPKLQAPFNAPAVRVGRTSLAAAASPQAALQQTAHALGVLGLLGVVKPGRPRPRRQQPRRPRPASKPAGGGSRPKSSLAPKVSPPPVRSYMQLLAAFRAAQAEEAATAASAENGPLPEHYPSSRPDLLPLRCRTELMDDPEAEDKLDIAFSWACAAARETGREDGSSKRSVLGSRWEHRATPLLERIRKLRYRQQLEAAGIRRTHRSNAASRRLVDDDPIVLSSSPPGGTGAGAEVPSSPMMRSRSSSSESRMGGVYQAQLPRLTRRPAAMSDSEAKWLQGYLDLGRILSLPDGSVLHSREEIMRRVQAVDPQAVHTMGLASAGSGALEGWDDIDVELFEAGLVQLGRKLPQIAHALEVASQGPPEYTAEQKRTQGLAVLRHIRESGGAPQGPSDDVWLRRVVAFYYNVWKTRGCPAAKKWYERKRQRQRPGLGQRPAFSASAPPASQAQAGGIASQGTDSDGGGRPLTASQMLQSLCTAARQPGQAELSKPEAVDRWTEKIGHQGADGRPNETGREWLGRIRAARRLPPRAAAASKQPGAGSQEIQQQKQQQVGSNAMPGLPARDRPEAAPAAFGFTGMSPSAPQLAQQGGEGGTPHTGAAPPAHPGATSAPADVSREAVYGCKRPGSNLNEDIGLAPLKIMRPNS